MAMIHRWDLQETSGTTVVDKMGESGEGGPQQPLREMHFDGVAGYVDLKSAYEPTTFTFLAELTVDSTSVDNAIFSNASDAGGPYFGVQLHIRSSDSYRPKLTVWNGTGRSFILFADPVPLDTPFVLGISFENVTREARYYIDGVFQSSSTLGRSITSPASFPLYFGRRGASDSWHFKGDMHDARFCGFVATDQQITDHYADLANNLTDTALWIKGEEQLDVAGGVDTVYDSGSNANHGVAIAGMTTVETASYSLANELGYTKGTIAQGLVVPRRETTQLDALSGALQYPGPNTYLSIGNNGTIDGSVALGAEGPGGSLTKAADFAGTSTNPIALDTPVVLPAAEDWSVAFWTQTDVADDHGMIFGDTSNTSSHFWLWSNSTKLQLRDDNDLDIDLSELDSSLGTLRHHVITHDGASKTTEHLIDNVSQGSGTMNNDLTLTHLGNGYTNSNQSLNGLLADFRIYNSILSSTETDALIALGADGVTIGNIAEDQFYQRPASGDLSITVSGTSATDEVIEYQVDSGIWQSLARLVTVVIPEQSAFQQAITPSVSAFLPTRTSTIR